MFETMQGFLAFFIPTLALIILGIIFEDKLVRFERALAAGLRKTLDDRRRDSENA